MQLPKKYLHDKFMLLLASSSIFLAFLCVALLLARLGAGEGGEGYIVEYRSNLGIGAFRAGSVVDMLSFGAFAILVAVAGIALSVRAYHIRRILAGMILGCCILLLVLTLIVSNALIVLR